MNIRISQKHWREVERLTSLSFVEGLEFAPETGCILLVAENNHRLRPCLLVAEVLEPETGDLLEQGSGGITLQVDSCEGLFCAYGSGVSKDFLRCTRIPWRTIAFRFPYSTMPTIRN